jgi:hypothetical protein
MTYGPGNERVRLRLPAALCAQLQAEAERREVTLSEIVVSKIMALQEAEVRRQEAGERRLEQLIAEVLALRDELRQLVGLLEALVQQQTPPAAAPEPQLPIATYEQMYGPMEQDNPAWFPPQEATPVQPDTSKSRRHWQWKLW